MSNRCGLCCLRAASRHHPASRKIDLRLNRYFISRIDVTESQFEAS